MQQATIGRIESWLHYRITVDETRHTEDDTDVWNRREGGRGEEAASTGDGDERSVLSFESSCACRVCGLCRC